MGIIAKSRAHDAPHSTWTEVTSLGISVHARTWSGGPQPRGRSPIVLVHGLGLSSRYMIPLGQRLAMLGYDVLAPDLPGFGRTSRPAGSTWPAGPDVREQTDQLLAWMDACGIRRAVLFGNSVGVQVIVELAARFPDRVDRLVLAGPTPDPKYRSPGKQYSRVVMNMPFEAPSLNPLFQVEYASAGIPRMVQQLRRTVGDPIENRLPYVKAPALVVRGRYDQTMSQPWAEEFTRMLPDAKLVVVEQAAHNVHYTAPLAARFVKAIVADQKLQHTFAFFSDDHDFAFGIDRAGMKFFAEQVNRKISGQGVPAALRVRVMNLEGLDLLSPPEPRIDLTGPGFETGGQIERPHDVCSCDNVDRCYGAAFIFRKPLSGSRITVPSSRAYWTTS
jgi:pimeloyl-ACP methyl ester carboxylesterase